MTSSFAGQERIDELQSEVLDWQHLHEVSTRLIQVSSLPEQLELILEAATRLADSTRGLISLYSPDEDCLVTFVSQGLDGDALAAVSHVEIGSGACGLSFLERSRVVIVDTTDDARYAAFRQYAARHDIGSICSTPFFGTDGEPLGVLSTYGKGHKQPSARELRLADVCAAQVGLLVSRAQTEHALKTERFRSEQILQGMSDGFVVVDRNFRVVQLNAEALRLDGRPSDEIVGLTYWEAWPGSEDLQDGLLCKDAMASRKSVWFEQWYRQNDIETCYSVAAHPYSDGLAIFYTDITAQRIAERTLRESEQRFHHFANSIPHLAWIADASGSIEWYNDRWYSYTGTTFSEMQGWKWQSVHHPDVLPTVMRQWTGCIEAGKPFEMTFPIRGADGIFRPFYTLVIPYRDSKGSILQWFGTNTDISALAEADKRKDEFLAMLAHELRNPLSPISSAAQLLSIPGMPHEQIAKASSVISRQVGHMTELIDDLLDVSRVTRGLISLEKVFVNAADIIEGATEQVRPLISSRGQHLSVTVDENTPHVTGDLTRLIQVMANLLNNASKFTPHGGNIDLTVAKIDTSVSISVSDSGVGIHPELLPRVFDLFAQAERTSDRTQGGLGLGLALVKGIVELHRGRVSAESKGPGRGARFEVLLPIGHGATAAPSAAKIAKPLLARKLRIAIVDDNRDSADSLSSVLAAQGHIVSVEYSGTALLKSLEFMPTQDVFILDIGLPEMDGYQLVSELLRLPHTLDSHMIALTGYGQAHDKALGKVAGFHDFFVKPLKFDDLALVLARRSQKI